MSAAGTGSWLISETEGAWEPPFMLRRSDYAVRGIDDRGEQEGVKFWFYRALINLYEFSSCKLDLLRENNVTDDDRDGVLLS